MTGVHSSSRPMRVRINRVLPWPRSPSNTRSCPASSARSSCGSTVSSKPTIPGNRFAPSRSPVSKLSRISALTVLWTWPEARSAPSVEMAGTGVAAVICVIRAITLPPPGGWRDLPTSGRLDAGGVMARFGDGLATDGDLVRAAETAVRQALDPLAGRTPDLVCVFVSGEEPDACGEALVRAAEVSGAAASVGCTAAGVIGGGRGVEAESAVSVWAGVLPDVHVRTFHLEVMRADAGLAVVGLPERADDDAVTVLFADPWSFPADGFVERSNEALTGLPIVGGLAGGHRGAGSTRLLVDGRVVERGAVGALLGGPVAARTLASQGCRPIGPAMTVTAAEGNVLLGLAGEQAIDKLEAVLKLLDPRDQALASQGLHIGIAVDEYAEEHDRGDFLIRGVLGADRSNGGLVIGDVVEVGRTVGFQVRDAESADDDLSQLLGRFRDKSGFDSVEGALLFSCNGRGAHLFGSADHDVLAVRRGLSTTGVAGFFAGGEIGPVGGRNHVHGFTASVLAFGSGSRAARGTAVPFDEPMDVSPERG